MEAKTIFTTEQNGIEIINLKSNFLRLESSIEEIKAILKDNSINDEKFREEQRETWTKWLRSDDSLRNRQDTLEKMIMEDRLLHKEELKKMWSEVGKLRWYPLTEKIVFGGVGTVLVTVLSAIIYLVINVK